jgi:putative phosphoribosyl transferase
MARFVDRRDAGRRLAAMVVSWPGLIGARVVVLGLPRGGVPVADEVARALAAPLGALVVRKLGVPHQPELAMGAIGEGGIVVMNEAVLASARVGSEAVAQVAARERAEVADRVRRYRRGLPAVELAGAVVVLVDDGIATGATVLAAVQVARTRGARRVLVASPVISPDARRRLLAVADEVLALQEPSDFRSVGSYYRDFRQVDEEEVLALLRPRDSAPPNHRIPGP